MVELKRGQLPEPSWFSFHPTEVVVALFIVALVIMYLLFKATGIWK